MKKTRTNSIMFITISVILLIISVGLCFNQGVLIYYVDNTRESHSIGICLMLTSIVLLIVGSIIIKEIHESKFDDVITTCDECEAEFESQKAIKKHRQGIFGADITYHCPSCKSEI